ncbi:hypothetical protein A9B99_05355 [Mangrovibacter phragmitis]|uniref:Uncharacterized protein n=1 Tax=Mangrovibacter phragmitis TaxID=1691903 RepID=A0A1B7L9V0_9ENTR|nr:hypothetical protein A9B99_05355 [Mangrovibacter phragmitis]
MGTCNPPKNQRIPAQLPLPEYTLPADSTFKRYNSTVQFLCLVSALFQQPGKQWITGKDAS